MVFNGDQDTVCNFFGDEQFVDDLDLKVSYDRIVSIVFWGSMWCSAYGIVLGGLEVPGSNAGHWTLGIPSTG